MDAPDIQKRARVDIDDEITTPADSKRRRLDSGDRDGYPLPIPERSSIRLSHDDYTVGWICALYKEMAAAKAMLDDIHESLSKDPRDNNTYMLGRIGRHNVVIASLPENGYGTNNAAIVATNMDRTFPFIRVHLMVGIGGGVPTQVDVRLGDVVVSTQVVQYDMGKTVRDGHFRRTGASRIPPTAMMTAVSSLRAKHELEPNRVPSILSKMLQQYPAMTKYIHHESFQDWLFDSNYDHDDSKDSCHSCDISKLLKRTARDNNSPKIHYGVVASGNQVMKHARTRDKLAQELDILCFEMEAAGLMDSFPCLVIRGICDYSDSHKNKQWQEYAAATAAAYTKELLSVIHPNDTRNEPTAAMFSNDQTPQSQRKALLESLSFEQIDSRQTNIKAAHAKTCQWFLQHNDYTSWLDPSKLDQHNGFLWIKGKPGAGKSTLMKFIYSQAKKTTKRGVTASFFFNARGDDLEKSTAGMYRSLLLQLLEEMPDLQEILDSPDLLSRHQRPSFTWKTDILCRLFADAIERLGGRSFTCFIDALDECDEGQVRDMVEDFEDLGQRAIATGTRFYICFSSRHYPHIEIQKGRQLVLEEQTGHAHDLEKFVKSRLKAGTGKFAEEIRNEVLRKAAGVFMWVVLVVDILNEQFRSGRQFAVKKRLDEIPTKLSELFKDILQRDNKNMDDLLLSIQWILYAKRPLKQEEFYFAVVSGLDPEQAAVEWDSDYTTLEIITRFVLSSSKGLAEVTRSKDHTVQFIHESVRDFLIKDNGLRELWPNLGEDFPSISHDRLKECCYNYIKVDISRHVPLSTILPTVISQAKALREMVQTKFPFLQYATSNVLYHADEAASVLPQGDFLKAFHLPPWINLANIFEIYQIRRYSSSASLLYILANTNRTKLIDSTLQIDPEALHRRGERYHYPILAAVMNGHLHAVEVLLQHQQDPSEHNTLLWAIYGGHEDIVYLLRQRGANPERWEERDMPSLSSVVGKGDVEMLRLFLDATVGGSLDYGKLLTLLLLVAIRKGHNGMVQLLLDRGANVNWKSGTTTPLCEAASARNTEMAKLLLNWGAEVNSPEKSSTTPLENAARKGHKEMVQLLLEWGAKVDAVDEYGETALYVAVVYTREEIAQLLLASGADVNHQTKDGNTPLGSAVSKREKGMVQLLLDNGAVVNTRDREGTPMICMAIKEGSLEIARKLLDKGAEVNSKDACGFTALSWAAISGYLDMIQTLIDRGAELDLKDECGLTPLHHAIAWEHEAVARVLREAANSCADP